MVRAAATAPSSTTRVNSNARCCSRSIASGLPLPVIARTIIACALDSLRVLQYHVVMQPGGYARAPASRLDATFAALADPTRRAILGRLASGDASVSELAQPFAMTQPAISKHLKVLQRAGLISRDRDAQRRPSRLVARPLAEASELVEHSRPFWGGWV